MFNGFIARLKGHAEKPLPPLDAHLAVGALLVQLAKSDAHYAFEEIVAIDKLLGERHGLNPVEAMKMRADCERLASDVEDSVEFTRLVHEAVPYEERMALVEALWDLALADRKLTPEEETLLAEVAGGLGILDQEAEDVARRYKARNAG